MQDEFEKFVKDNKENFDTEVPSFQLWNNIEPQLNEQDKTQQSPLKIVSSARRTIRMKMVRYASIAAVGLLLLTVGGVIGSYWTVGGEPQVAGISLGEVSDEYAEVEQHYAQQVNLNIEKLKKLNYDEAILKDIEELDIAFQELKQELGHSNEISNEEIIHAMIENYQMKIDILERVLNRMKPKQKVIN